MLCPLEEFPQFYVLSISIQFHFFFQQAFSFFFIVSHYFQFIQAIFVGISFFQIDVEVERFFENNLLFIIVRSTGFIRYMYIDFLMKMAALVLRDLCTFFTTLVLIQLILLENQIFYFSIVYIEFKEFYFILRYMNGVQQND